MKSRDLLLGALTAAVILVSPQLLLAQGGFYKGSGDNPNGPTVSPYLNLLQVNSQGLNSYQTMVKPIIDQQNAINRQGSQLGRLQNQVNQQAYGAGAGSSGTRGTGHQTQFQNTSHYFPAPRRK